MTQSGDINPSATASDLLVLRERARRLAQVPEPASSRGESIEVLEFRLAAERYAVEVGYVREVHPFKDLTPLPGTPAFLLGVVNVRGHIISVVDLKKFFELPLVGLTDLHRVIVVRGNDMELGLLADVVVGVGWIQADQLQSSLPTLTGVRADYLKGVTGEGLVLLDMGRILADPRIVVDDETDA